MNDWIITMHANEVAGTKKKTVIKINYHFKLTTLIRANARMQQQQKWERDCNNNNRNIETKWGKHTFRTSWNIVIKCVHILFERSAVGAIVCYFKALRVGGSVFLYQSETASA